MTAPTVYIVGAGLSGMALAESLSRPERGASVRIVLLEGRPYPGGRVSSYREAHTGQWVDNGQHLFMDVYSSMLSFLDRLGTRNRVIFPTPFAIELLDGKDKSHTFSIDPKLGRIGGLLGVLSFSGLSIGSRLSMLKAGSRMSSGGLKEATVDHLDARTFLIQCGATHESIERFWELLVVSATNLSSSDVSAALLLRILRETLFGSRGPSLIGWSSVSHRELVIDPALDLLGRRGVDVRLKSAVGQISLSGDHVKSIVVKGRELTLSPNDHLVLAMPPWSLEKILPIEMMGGELCQNIIRLSFSSGIVSIHLWFSRLLALPAIGGFMSGPIHWVFNKDRMAHPESSVRSAGKDDLEGSSEGGDGARSDGSFLSLTVSGVDVRDETPEEEWVRRALMAVERFAGHHPLPDLVHHRVIRERMSTPILGPGQSLYRPSNQTGVSNMWLCGDTTDTGLPATMESAVRSAHVLSEILFSGPLWGGGLK